MSNNAPIWILLYRDTAKIADNRTETAIWDGRKGASRRAKPPLQAPSETPHSASVSNPLSLN